MLMLQSGLMSSHKTIASLLTTAVSAAAVLTFAVPAANADISGQVNTNGSAITSSRSFPSYSAARKDLTVEHTSTDVEDSADWGSTESLDVPQTKSQAEKDREDAEAKAKAEEEARIKAEAEAAAALAAQSQAASRSQQRTSPSDSSSASTSAASVAEVSGNAGAAVAAAYSLLGQSMDCTALVSAALAAGGINFHGWPEEYANLGEHVTEPQPGDILVYRYTGGFNGGVHWDHVAIYVGNGKAVHGGWNGSNVVVAGMMNPDIIVRVF